MVNIHQYWVYIMSNKSRTVLYIGITNDLYRRYLEHKQEVIKGFSYILPAEYIHQTVAD